jgi:hypothetical protein
VLRVRRRGRPGLPAGWQDILAARSAQWAVLDDDERLRLGDLAEELLVTKRWEAARGFTITDEVRTLVAAHAGLLLLGLEDTRYDVVGTIVVRSGSMRRRAPMAGPAAGVVVGSPGPVDGEAHHDDGPVMINWGAARREARNPRLGRDVVIHEFAHKLDMLDGTVDGTPPLAGTQRSRWIEVCTAEYELVRAGAAGPLLRSYAATNPGEFFAVATEAFFTRPIEMEALKPELYEVFAGYYGQHPAARVRRAAGS